MWWTATFQPEWVISLLPPTSSTPWETVLDLVDGGLVARDPLGLIAASRSVADVPLAWLPYLAEERSVDEFSSAWPEARQRAVTAASLGLHRIKGTRLALEMALAPMGYSAQVIEWFETTPRRQAYTFRLSVTIDADREWFLADHIALVRAANKAKNLHTKLEAIEVRRTVGPAAVYFGGKMRTRIAIRIGPPKEVGEVRVATTTFVGAAIRQKIALRIGPRR